MDILYFTCTSPSLEHPTTLHRAAALVEVSMTQASGYGTSGSCRAAGNTHQICQPSCLRSACSTRRGRNCGSRHRHLQRISDNQHIARRDALDEAVANVASVHLALY